MSMSQSSNSMLEKPQAIALPAPRTPIAIRAAVMSDMPFIDSLQKMHGKQVGWMPTKQLEQKIAVGHVLVAEERSEVRDQRSEVSSQESAASSLTSDLCPLTSSSPLGYCIGQDQYFKRDDLGIIYQLNVAPAKQRRLIGVTLIKAMFERAAYGCRLFCCWCAQDIAANHFWESMGFVPLAFRAGSRGKERIHIFWQRRIRAGDATTPYWFPSQTTSGSIREDRLVFPIPPGTLWSDAKPILLPGAEDPQLESRAPKVRSPKTKVPAIKPSAIASGGLRFAAPKEAAIEAKPKPEPRRKVKNDPRLVAAARELRDRWLEQVNASPSVVMSSGKYDVTNEFAAAPANQVLQLPHPIAA